MICRTLLVFFIFECVVSAASFVSATSYDRSAGLLVAGFDQFEGISLQWTAGESNDYPSSRYGWSGSLVFDDTVGLSLASMNLRLGDQVDDRLFAEVLDVAPDLSVAVRKSYSIGLIPPLSQIFDEVSADQESYIEGFVLNDVQVKWDTPFEGLDGDWASISKDLYSPYHSSFYATEVDSRYVGFRKVVDGQTHFGFFEVLASERGFRLGTLHLNDRPGEAIGVSSVPEPKFALWWPWFVAALSLARRKRKLV